jgi:hypothetical protein
MVPVPKVTYTNFGRENENCFWDVRDWTVKASLEIKPRDKWNYNMNHESLVIADRNTCNRKQRDIYIILGEISYFH